MGQITVDLGFDAKSRRITVDGKPEGEPISFGSIAKRVVADTRRKMLLNSTSKRAHIWGSMPKPEGEE